MCSAALAASVLIPIILTGCGGSAPEKLQIVRGTGFLFQAPPDWTVSRKDDTVSAASGPVDLVQAHHFTLVKPYRPALFAQAGKELDATAAKLARQNEGRVAARETRAVAGRKSWYYRIDFGPGKTEEIAFVLQGRDEYYLLCRRAADADDGDCARLFATFTLGG